MVDPEKNGGNEREQSHHKVVNRQPRKDRGVGLGCDGAGVIEGVSTLHTCLHHVTLKMPLSKQGHLVFLQAF